MRAETLPGDATQRSASRDPRARACQFALALARDPDRLKRATLDELRVAAMFLARALAPFADEPASLAKQKCIAELETAGRAIGGEIRRRGGLGR